MDYIFVFIIGALAGTVFSAFAVMIGLMMAKQGGGRK